MNKTQLDKTLGTIKNYVDKKNYISSRGNITAESGTTYPTQKGLSMTQAYNNSYPISYGNVMTMYGSGVSQLLIGWSGTNGAHEKAYIRSKRDTSDANYSGWAQIYTSAHPQPSVTGSSGSCTGNAATATKLQTARTINGTSFNGTANITTANWGTSRKLNRTTVNGSADVSIPLDYITCGVANNNTNNYHLILESGQCTGDYTDKSIIIMVCNHYNNNSFGIAKATLRTNNASNGDKAAGELIWIVRCGFAANVLCYNIRNTAKDTYMDVFYKSSGTYNSATIYILGEGARGNQSSQWTKNNTNATGTKAYTETAMKALRSYTSTLVSAVDAGVVNKANQLVNARTLTIGSKGKTFDGSANVSWSLSEIGALPLSGGTLTGATTFNDYLKLNAWPNYGSGTADFWYDGTNKTVEIETATDLKLNGTKVSKSGHTHSAYLPKEGGTLTGATTFNNYLKLNAWSGHGSGTANFWYDGTNKTVEIETATDLKLAGTKVSKSGHTHNYAGSSSAGGSATSAVKLDTSSAGSSTQPVYFNGGKPTACIAYYSKSAIGDIAWTTADNNAPVTVSAIAYWNGAYKDTSSNLAYCKHGAIGTMATKASGDYLAITGGTLTGDTTFNNYLKLNAWSGYGSGTANFWYAANSKTIKIENATNLTLNDVSVSKEGHTHNYLPLTGGTISGSVVLENNAAIGGKNTSGTPKWLAWVDLSNTANFGDTGLKTIINSSVNPVVNVGGTTYQLYHTGNKPTAAEIGAAPASHTHNYLPLTGGTVSGETVFTNYLSVKAWPNYGTGTAQLWYDGNNKLLNIQNATGIKAGNYRVATWEGSNPTHHMFRYGSGLGGANGYITFSY